MNRSTLKIVVVALLAATAIVAVAGSVDDARTGEGGASSSVPDEETETAVESTTSAPTEQTNQVFRSSGANSECMPANERPLLWFGVVSALGLVVGGVYVQRGQMSAIAVALVFLVLLFLAYSLLGVCTTGTVQPPTNGSEVDQPKNNITDFEPDEANGSGSGSGDAAPDLPLAVVAVLALLDNAVVVSVVLAGVFLGSVLVLSALSAVHMLLALAGVEYRFYDSGVVAYDRHLGEPQWSASYDRIRDVSVDRGVFGSPLWLDAGTVFFDRLERSDGRTFVQQEPRSSIPFVSEPDRVGEILRSRGDRLENDVG